MEKINKEIAMNTLIECCCYNCPAGDYRKACDDSCDLKAVLDYIKIHLKDDACWIAKPYEIKGNQRIMYICSECRWHSKKRMPYCSCCGSNMLNSKEIRELKKITRAQRDEITQLNARINELETQLVESRAKEGMGVLETTIKTFGEMITQIGEDLSEMFTDCPDDCEHCDYAKIEIEEDGDT